jgi:hypothetical protein
MEEFNHSFSFHLKHEDLIFYNVTMFLKYFLNKDKQTYTIKQT